MPRTAVNGTEIYYESHGTGPAMVFVHGGGGNHLSWWQQVPAFAQRYRCIVFDQRGFGATPSGAPPVGLATLTDDLVGLLDFLEIERAILVAQSLGGWPCWELAVRQPDRVRALVMSGTVGGIPIAGIEEWAEQLRRRQMGSQPLASAVAPHLERERPELYFLYWSILRLNPPVSAENGILNPDGLARRIECDLATFSIPALFVTGENDALMPPELVHAAARVLPGARLEHVARAGHSVYFEQAALFNDTVSRFLEGIT